MIEIRQVTTPEELAAVHEIRRIVFVEEQHCPPDLEYENEDVSTHYIAYSDGQPVGTARWRITDKGYKLERFAVLYEFRTKQVGTALLKAVIDGLPDREHEVYLHAQVYVKDFYKKLGFESVGDHFWEAGIEHVKMKLSR